MPEVLGESGIYFDPLKPASIQSALTQLADSREIRARSAQGAYGRARDFS